MDDLLGNIRMAQIRAAEEIVVAALRAEGLVPQRCQGTNCHAGSGDTPHSPECILEAAEAQGWLDSPEARAAQTELDRKQRGEPVRVIVDWKRDPSNPVFVEAETPEGRGISIPWYDRADGLKELRLFTAPQPAEPVKAAQPSLGWKLVPIVPTRSMKEAGGVACGRGHDFAHHTWSEMLEAAPTPPTDEQAQQDAAHAQQEKS